MSIKEQIEDIKEEIRDLEREKSRIESEIRDEEFRKRQADSNKTLGIAFMGNSNLRTYGTYKYISSSNESSHISSIISNLESKKSDVSWKISDKKSELDRLQEKYRNLPISKLIATENGILIDGDTSRRDLLEPLYKKIDDYIAEHKKVRESTAVANYITLKQKLEDSVKNSNLPESSKKNIEELQILKNRLQTNFDFVVIEGKLLVGSDFISRYITSEQDKIKNFQKRIDDNQARRDKFEPTFWGKIFKGVREKQLKELEEKIKNCDFEYTTYRDEAAAFADYYTEVKSKYVEPATEQMKLLSDLKDLKIFSLEVSKYVNGGKKYQQDIDPNTILKDIGITDIPTYLINNVQSYLDKNDLRLTRETVLEAIANSVYHQDLSEKLANIGYKQNFQQSKSEVQNQTPTTNPESSIEMGN